MMSNKYISEPISLENKFRNSEFYRADLKFYEVDHSGATYDGRVFFNNPNADENTPMTAENGYAGSFYIFGHGGCFGDVGHCDFNVGKRAYDKRRPHPIQPVDAFVTVTEALRIAIEQGSELIVTVVPIILSATEFCNLENCLQFRKFEIVTYSKPMVRL
jgi:hypothetical protein